MYCSGGRGAYHVNVDGHEDGEEQHGQRAKELVNVLICNHRERAGVVEKVVVLVLLPANQGGVSEAVIVKFPKIRQNPDQHETHEIVAQGVAAVSAVPLRLALVLEVQGH